MTALRLTVKKNARNISSTLDTLSSFLSHPNACYWSIENNRQINVGTWLIITGFMLDLVAIDMVAIIFFYIYFVLIMSSFIILTCGSSQQHQRERLQRKLRTGRYQLSICYISLFFYFVSFPNCQLQVERKFHVCRRRSIFLFASISLITVNT